MRSTIYALSLAGSAAVTLLVGMTGNPTGTRTPVEATTTNPVGTYAFAQDPGGPGPTGTYLIRFGAGSASLLGVGTVHSDGTWSLVDQTDNGAIPGFTSRQSPWRGIWRHTGSQQTLLNGICLNFDANGIPIGSQRVDGYISWQPGFLSGTGFASQRKYTNTENPLDPNGGTAEPPPLNNLPVTAQKMVQ